MNNVVLNGLRGSESVRGGGGNGVSPIHSIGNGVKAVVCGIDSAGEVQPITDNLATKTNQEVAMMDINNSGAIGDGQSTQTRMCLGYDRSGGAGRSLLVDSGGSLTLTATDALLTGAQTSSGVATCVENTHFNAQQATQSIAIADGAMGNTTDYNTQKYSRISVIVKETLNSPSNTAKGVLLWSDNADVYVSTEAPTIFTERKQADGSASLGFWWSSNVNVVAKYCKVEIYNNDGGGASHTYDIDCNLTH